MQGTIDLEVFVGGDYGERGNYTAADVAAIAADYDPALHEAPITVDHTKSGPAWGWVEKLKAVGNSLWATVRQMPEAFKELVRAGRYKKRSVELYRQFGATGRPYLRAVTFLGALPPEVKGLADVQLGEADAGVAVIAFGEGDAVNDSELHRELALFEECAGKSWGTVLAEFREGEDHYSRVGITLSDFVMANYGMDLPRAHTQRSMPVKFIDEYNEGVEVYERAGIGLEAYVAFREREERERASARPESTPESAPASPTWDAIAVEFAEVEEHYAAHGITLDSYARIVYGVERPAGH
jgi:hypothetical protein